MSLKIKLGSKAGSSSSIRSTPTAEAPPLHAAGVSGRPKIKLKSSAPPTPATETPPASLAAPLGPPTSKPKKTPGPKKPAAERRTTLSLTSARRSSIKQQQLDEDELALATPSSAGPKISLKRKLAAPDRRDSSAKGRFLLKNRKALPPKRPIGVGYDSEASDAEEDPLIEHQYVLRMQPGSDCDYLREAIANKTLGASKSEGGADVSMKFLDKDWRRCIINIRGQNYAAVMVDLPCIIEGMKSWDKRGWWKVADIHQMLLVLGPTNDDATAKAHLLPKEIDSQTWAYAHGLTPPMHYVRKRRFRKRASYKTVEHIDEEVERLLALDKEAESATYRIVDDNEDAAAAPDDEYYDDDEDDEPGDYLSTTENGYGQSYIDGADADADADEEMDFGDLEADILAGLEMDTEITETPTTASAIAPLQPLLPNADAAATLGAADTAMAGAIPSTTTAAASALAIPATAAPGSTTQAADGHEESDDDEEEEDSSSDEDSDEDEPAAVDEDLVERERELEGQKQDLEELERRIAQAKADISAQKNPLLRQRKVKTLRDLEEELGVKRRAMGLGDEDDGYDE